MRKSISLLVLAVLMGSLLASPARVWAQSADDDADSSDLGMDSDDGFGDQGDGFGSFTPGSEEEQSEGGQYVDESTQSGRASVDLSGRQAQVRINQERNQLPLNAGWGAATGLLIGGWLSLLNQGDNRSNLQNIGTGVVAGVVLGLFVGARTVIDPSAPVPQGVMNDTTPSGKTTTTPLVALDNHGLKVGVLFQF
jgi:hypothetical protein